MTLTILFASILSALNLFHTDDRVATASLVFQVEDDRGAPVEDAKVDVFFDMVTEPGRTVSANTDSNGVCRVKGKTVGMMNFRVRKEDYYSSYGKIILNAAGQEHEKLNGKWQPWGMEQKVVLPKVKNRIGLSFKYWADKFVGSDLDGVYAANPSAKYLSELSFSTRIWRNEKGRIYKREIKMFDEAKTLVGRTRCVLDEQGELLSATYFQICYMTFVCNNKGAALRYYGFYNPTPNDTNIEPK